MQQQMGLKVAVMTTEAVVLYLINVVFQGCGFFIVAENVSVLEAALIYYILISHYLISLNLMSCHFIVVQKPIGSPPQYVFQWQPHNKVHAEMS